MSMLFSSSDVRPAPRATVGADQNCPALERALNIRRCPQSVFEVITRKPPTKRAVMNNMRHFMLINSAASYIRPAPVRAYSPSYRTYRLHNRQRATFPREAAGG